MTMTPDSATPTSLERDVPLLAVRDLHVEFYGEHGTVHAVQGVDWEIRPGETLGVVGESGSGKSVTAAAIMGLVPITGRVASGEIVWRGHVMSPAELAAMRGTKVAMIFQDPMSALNPLVPTGRQVTEVLRRHRRMSRHDARRRAIELFELVGIPEPVRRFSQFPFQFSGGMAQRVVIAMALAAEPELLIADEPTTALDVTIQAQILELLADLQKELGIAVVLITHDLGVVAGVADRVAVMYGGRVVETGLARDLLTTPSHPYTTGLLESTPHPRRVRERLVPIPGSPPVVSEVVPGCAFAPRCSHATEECRLNRPVLQVTSHGSNDRKVACWHAA